MKRLRFAFALFASFASSGNACAQDIEIPCDNSPSSAVLAVPAPGDRFLHILCTRFGHVLAPVAGWFWTQPGAYSPVFFPAQMVQSNPIETGNTVYFGSITVSKLSGKEAQDSWAPLAKVFPADQVPTSALQFVAQSSSGSKHVIYIFPNAWGYSCSPVCSNDGAFLMVSQNKQPPTW